MRRPKSLIAAAALTALVSSQAIAAQPEDRNPNSPGLGWANGKDKDSGESKGVPGPVAGVGLSYLLLAGGYALFRRYRSRS